MTMFYSESQLKEKEELMNKIQELRSELHSLECDLENLKRNCTPSIEEMIKLCADNGITVSKSGTWLWVQSDDGRFNKDVDEVITLAGERVKVTLQTQEGYNELLKEMGFKYSSNRMKWYWISN